MDCNSPLPKKTFAVAGLMRLMDCAPWRGKTAGPEDVIAIDIGTALRAWTLEGRLRATWTSIPHEAGGTSRKNPSALRLAMARYARLKAHGLITGSADYCFIWPEGGGWIEVKSASGSLSPAQQDFRDWCMATGSNWAKARSVAEVEDILVRWGALHGR